MHSKSRDMWISYTIQRQRTWSVYKSNSAYGLVRLVSNRRHVRSSQQILFDLCSSWVTSTCNAAQLINSTLYEAWVLSNFYISLSFLYSQPHTHTHTHTHCYNNPTLLRKIFLFTEVRNNFMLTQLNSVKMAARCVETTHVNSLSHVRLRSSRYA